MGFCCCCCFVNIYWSIFDLQCSVSAVSKVNQLYIHMYSLLFRSYFSIGHYRVLSRVPCVIKWVPNGYIFDIQQCVYVNPNLPSYPSLSWPLVNMFAFYICDSVSVLYNSKVHFYYFSHNVSSASHSNWLIMLIYLLRFFRENVYYYFELPPFL